MPTPSPRSQRLDARVLAPITHSHALEQGATIQLDAWACRALDARKINVKEAFTLQDSAGSFFRASLTAMDLSTETGEALVYERMRESPESPARITLACAVLQRQRMLIVAQKGTELGMARLQPLFTTRSVRAEGLAHEKHFAWPGQTLKGARQCRRASLPEVCETVALESFLTSDVWKRATVRVFLDDRSESGQLSSMTRATHQAPTDCVLVVGPEGGFADHERAALHEAGGIALRLGGRVLRAETAVFAGLTALQMRMGDMQWDAPSSDNPSV